jgi:nucleoside 2-deoxyribosyltransferase
MDTCFVIQPFDKDKFDKRYKDVFEPAIIAAGLEPYRVDRDPSVRIPIEQIEEGIKNSKLCFADITSDNPNVWYELGFAFASDKDVVMVTEERQKFPFDIQHKHVINYKTSSKSDFEELENNISTKLKAFLQKRVNVQLIIENPIKESEGLTTHEATMILVLFENQITEEDTVSAYQLYRDMEATGFNRMASNVAFRLLKSKGFIEQKHEYSEQDREPFTVFTLTQKGEQWVLNNQDKIEFKKKNSNSTDKLLNDLPF